jgi:hypothetical protein
MSEMLRDGTGSGNLQKVDANNRALTRSVNTPEDEQATKLGTSYNINTGIIDLTNANETPLIYIKNNEDEDLHIQTIIIGTWSSTGGSGTDGVPKAVFLRNPITGTTVENTNDVDIISNRNYGSSKTLTVDAYKGATGETLTGGTDHIIIQMGTSGRTVVSIDEVIPKGSSFGIKYTPQGSNTSQKVYAAVVAHLIDPNE